MASWDDVVSVEAATEAPPGCPICLEDAPLPAPQITPCGHVFCFPCIARHLAAAPARSGGGSGGRGGGQSCPMCFTAVEMGELRKLTHAATSPPAAGAVAGFTLMARARGSLVPHPVGAGTDEVADADASGLTWPRASREGRACRWAKFSLTSDEDGAAAADLAQLEAAAAFASAHSAEAAQMLPALSAAMDALKARAAAWAARRADLADAADAAEAADRAAAAMAKLSAAERAPPPPPPPGAADGAWESDGGDASDDVSGADPNAPPAEAVPPAEARDADEAAAEAELLAGLGRGGDGDGDAVRAAAEASSSSAAAAVLEGGSSSHFMFYLSDDGGFATLHPATVRALLSGCGGSYGGLPRAVRATVVATERGVVSDATRRRLRFLGHLPLRAPFALAELSLEELSLPPAALAAHAPDAAFRARRRAAAERADAAASARAQRAAEAQQAAHAAAAAALRAQAASVLSERLQDAAMPPLRSADAAENVPIGASPPAQPGGVSFARVADLGYASGLNAPGLMLASSPPGGAAAWPAASAPAPVEPGPRPSWGPRAAVAPAPEAGDGGAAPAKKGKAKATLLMSTSQRRY